MIGKRFSLKVVLLALALISLYLLVATRPARAQNAYWIRWLIDITYPTATNEIDMQLIVQKVSNQGIEAEHSEPVSCQAVGNPGFPAVQNGEATFDGGSYFECDVPSIQEIAWEKLAIGIPPTCTVKKKPFAVGRMTPETNPNQVNPKNPIFFREDAASGVVDIQFAIPLDTASQPAQAELVARFGRGTPLARSSSFTVDPAGHTVLAIYDQPVPDLFTPIFRQSGNTLSANPATITGPLVLSNLESTVQVGHSPITNSFYEGKMGVLRVDPYCPSGG